MNFPLSFITALVAILAAVAVQGAPTPDTVDLTGDNTSGKPGVLYINVRIANHTNFTKAPPV